MEDKLITESPLPGTPGLDEHEQQVKMFEKLVEMHSNNRADRRRFKKMFGVMPPPKNVPFIKKLQVIDKKDEKSD